MGCINIPVQTAEDRDVEGSNPSLPIRLKLLNMPEIFNTEEDIENQETSSRLTSRKVITCQRKMKKR